MSVTVYPSGPTSVVYHDKAIRDAFGRLRGSEPFTVFDSKQIFDNQPLYFDDQEVSGSGTGSAWVQNEAATTLSVAATTAGKRGRQTFQKFNYQSGKSQLIFITGVPVESGGGAGIIASIGLFDDDNGIFFSDNEGTPRFTVRSNYTGTPVDDAVAQPDWNGDKLDGNGKSGFTLDTSKSQIIYIDFEWLGVGAVRAGFVIDGQLIICHTFFHANATVGVYMSTPNLPIRYSIENDGTGAASEMQHICSTVISEGGLQDVGTMHWASTGATSVAASASGTIYAVLGIRQQTTALGQTVKLLNISMINTATQDFEWLVVFNPTIAGTFTYADHTDGNLQVATGATANAVTNGVRVNGGFVKSSNNAGSTQAELDNALHLGSTISGTRDEIVLCVRPLGNNANIHGGICWRELT